jgi:hypothetical protein
MTEEERFQESLPLYAESLDPSVDLQGLDFELAESPVPVKDTDGHVWF